MTAYQHSFGTKKQRPQTTAGPRTRQEPLVEKPKEEKPKEDPHKDLHTVASQRRFGDYSAAVDKQTAKRLRSSNSLGPFEQLPTGYHQDGKTVRCVDRFVKYPYPPMAISYYKKEFPKKNAFAKDHRTAFNMEKETKIINPHDMEMKTTMKEVFQGKQGPRALAKK